MTRFFKNIYSTLAFIGLTFATTACSDDMPSFKNPDINNLSGISWNEDGSLSVDVTLQVPEMGTNVTRALGDTPNYADLKLYLLVFDETDGTRKSYQVIDPSENEPDNTHNQMQFVKFNATLYPTENNAIIHLIATNQSNMGEQLADKYAEDVLYRLYTDEGNEAYWARIKLGQPIPEAKYVKETEELTEESQNQANAILEKLSHVPMVRNFLRISAQVAEGVPFTLEKIYVVNAVNRGKVVPVLTNESSPKFIDFFEKFDNGLTSGKDYEKIHDDQDFTGENSGMALPAEIITNDLESLPENINGSNLQTVYIYERPHRNTNHTYVIVQGKRNNEGSSMYYKIDLGKRRGDTYGKFEFYDLIRNFDYRINITGADADGYSTPEAAKAGSVFNNIIASVETQNLTSLSYGGETIKVNKTSYVFSANNYKEGFPLIASYLKDGSNVSANLNIDNPDKENGFLEIGEGTYDNGEKRWIIKVKDGIEPPTIPLTQTIVVYLDETGLYREITFIYINHFNIQKIDTYPGLWESFEDAPWEWPEGDAYDDENGHIDREVGQGVDAPLTLFFQLPENLPQAIFPLDFTIESNRQNIQNAYVGSAVVNTVPASKSLFWDNGNGGVTTSRIQYIKTVTWDEYNSASDGETQGTGSNIVRVRFLTTTDLAQDGIGEDPNQEGSRSQTTLRVYNQYFDMAWDTFTRDTETSDPTPHTWDFSSSAWESMISTLGNPQRNTTLTDSNNITEGLILKDGQAFSQTGGRNPVITYPSIRSGENNGYSYINFTNDNDQFYYPLTYSGNNDRTLRVEVMCTNQNGNPVEPLVYSGGTAPGNQLNLKEIDNSSSPYTTYIFEKEIKKTTDDKTITGDVYIKRPSNTETRFYQITISAQSEQYITDDSNP